ncbi:hypothetical protein [Paenibacillus amylolyticus]|uniref:hypothetical protein n=1 Tax=Paenibacillus amylolyticus TaxID=1451 RepID=UPI00096ED8B9|nr:hypothetical protein [Paenibacillus amylolyticus]OMF47736.1 hypothetical protein BK136_02255 [Paenibacillus amylolyticus]
MSEKLTKYIHSITPAASERIQEKLETIEKDRKHDERVGWVEVAGLLKSLPVHELVKVIKGQTLGIDFSTEELGEIRRALGQNISNIDRFIESDKVNEKGKAEAEQWKSHNESAQAKIIEHFEF